MGRMTVRGFE